MANKKMYLDQEGYNQYLNELADLTSQLEVLQSKKYNIDGVSKKSDRDFLDYEEKFRSEAELKNRILEKKEGLNYIEIISRKEIQDNTVDIGDVLKLTFVFSAEDMETGTYRLVACPTTNINCGSCEDISINGPLGECLYGQEVGKVTSFKVRDNKVVVKIEEKMNLEQTFQNKKR